MPRTLPFVKMSAAGNDFIVIDDRKHALERPVEAAKTLCDRKGSVGADGLILLEQSKRAAIRMRIFNPDGSEAEMCGNGVRCLAKFAADKKITGNKLTVETLAGIIEASVKDEKVRAKMIDPKELEYRFSVRLNGKAHEFNYIDTGVPHAVELVRSVQKCDVERLGRAVRYDTRLAPRGTNVDFVSTPKKNRVELRTYERGVEGETLACGTGAAAAALVAARLKAFGSPIRVHTRSGETLKVFFKKTRLGYFTDVTLEGSVRTSFEGRVSL